MGAGAPAAGGNGAESRDRQPWRPGDTGSITHHRERTIPPDLAARYLANQDPGPVATHDGRQAMFRRDALVDLGSGGFDDAAGVKLRFEAPDQAGTLDGGPGDAEFGGRAELVAEDATGAEEVLGTYRPESQSWAPTSAGQRWLHEAGTGTPGQDRGRTP